MQGPNVSRGAVPRAWVWLALIPAVYFLFLFNLTGVGLLGPDEPRYAAIGREMARSGDWITPRLWGEPWFEKPALLYWMTAAAFRAGLGDDLAPRLPVALLSVGFLIFY
jgi:4-amino-4-deoxy-L-arabinose transferase-like glycosyltransferase